MKQLISVIRAVALWAVLASKGSAADSFQLDPEGYIRDWIMLAPIALPEGAPAGDLLLKEQVSGEANLKPKAGDEVTVKDKQLTWKQISAPAHFFDFNAILKSQNDHVAGYMVTYIECDNEVPNVIVAVASNDQGRIYFNGVDIYAFTEARPLMLDADKGRVTLKKGVNVFVFKIINEVNSWQGAMRLLDKAGTPLKNIKIKLSP